MAAPRKISDQQRQLIMSVCEARRRLPSDKELARSIGVSVVAIRWTMAKLSLKIVSRETDFGTLLPDPGQQSIDVHGPDSIHGTSR